MTFLFEILSRLTCKNIEETLYKIIIQIQIRFKTLIWRQEFQTKSSVSSGFTNVNEQEYFQKLTKSQNVHTT